MEEMNPCPFCLGEARIAVCDSEGNIRDWAYEDDPYSGMSYGIVHGLGDYSGECPIASDDPLPWLYDTREEAIGAWNHRAGD